MKIKIFNNRVEISVHQDNYVGKTHRKIDWNTRIVNNDEPFTTVKQYEKTLSRQKSNLYNVKLDYEKCKFLTLGTDCSIGWDDMEKYVKEFITNFKYRYGNVKYIASIEHYEQGFNRWHAHLILIFPNTAPSLNQDWLKKHWSFGRVDIKNLYEFREHGLIHYLTKRKESNINQEKPWLTKYPQFAKFIRTSRDLPQDEYIEKECSMEQFNNFQKQAQENGANINYVGHYYGADSYCLDKVYIHDAEDTINEFFK